MKKLGKSSIALTLTTVFLTTGIVTAAGDLIQKTIEVSSGVKIFVDDKEFITPDANGEVAETFIYNGLTYAPARALSEALGRKVTWNENSSNVNITTDSALVIKEQGNFSAGGTVETSEGKFDPMQPWTVAQGGQTRHGDHADVLYQVPVNANDYPMVFLHGYGQSRRSWQTTADGREGFSNIFLRKGYSTYLVDQPGRGEAGQVTGAGQINAVPDDQTWFTQFRIGLWPNFYEGVQFPKDSKSLDQFFRMMVPDTGTTAERNATVTAMSDVFDRTGPGILFTHSASGMTGWQTAIANENVKAIVSVEPGGFPFPIDPNANPARGGIEMDDFMS
jgi:pimeloyl-ACP methyl ester carboxylesterase